MDRVYSNYEPLNVHMIEQVDLLAEAAGVAQTAAA